MERIPDVMDVMADIGRTVTSDRAEIEYQVNRGARMADDLVCRCGARGSRVCPSCGGV